MSDTRRIFWLLITLPFLLLLALALRDLISALWDQKKLGDAAFGGVEWARANSFDQSGITTAAQSAADLPQVKVMSWSACGCPSGGRIFQFKCDAKCPAGQLPHRYVVVTTSVCFSPVLAWPGVAQCQSGNSQCDTAGCTAHQVLLSAQSIALQ